MATTANMPAYMLPGLPVHQPPHLEGDASLATEILPGPPSLLSAHQSAQRRDPKKPSISYSYLPPSDPGSTYSGIMHGTLIGQEPVEGPRSKRSRVDKGLATGRAQRASARNQNTLASTTDPVTAIETVSGSATYPVMMESDPHTTVVEDEPSLSRSNSSLNLLDAPTSNTNGRQKRRDKGKAKEVEAASFKVKEEPKTISLHTPEPTANLVNNDDHCSSCRSNGALVYCDGCPRAFHLWCLDPPMEEVDEGDSRWFCPSCVMRKHPPRKPPPSLLSPLIHQLETSIPVEYQLPEDVRTFFKDVTTGPKGTYVDSSEIKQPRLNRHGQLEDRDPHRLRDRNGVPVLCFQCGMSALPGGLAASAPATKRARRSTYKAVSSEKWRDIVSCDYCSLHWHLDCLDPPLLTMPAFNKKWMCPNHAEQVLPLKRRIPRQNALPVEITQPRQFNNGNIEVINPESAPDMKSSRVPVDEVLINGRRYRVPERIIVLDFWTKLNKHQTSQVSKGLEPVSGMSSPLTSLSSLDDMDDRNLSDNGQSISEMDVAHLLNSLKSFGQASSTHSLFSWNSPSKKTVDSSVQTLEIKANSTPTITASNAKAVATVKRTAVSSAVVNGSNKTPTSASDLNSAGMSVISSNVKRKRTMQSHNNAEATTRELRSNSRVNNDSRLTSLTSISSRGSLRRWDDSSKDSLADGSMSAPPLPSSATLIRRKSLNVKVEETELLHHLISTPFEAGTSTPIKALPRQTRAPRRSLQKDGASKDTREKRGRKRKDGEEETIESGKLVFVEKLDRDKEMKARPDEKPAEKEKRKSIRTPARQGHLMNVTTLPSPSVQTTPSLKIRLPRLNSINMPGTAPSLPNFNSDTQTRL